jgi:hypothetical protein
MLSGIIRIMSGISMLAIGIGMFSTIDTFEAPLPQIMFSVIAMISAALGVYVLVGNWRRGKNRGGNDDSA